MIGHAGFERLISLPLKKPYHSKTCHLEDIWQLHLEQFHLVLSGCGASDQLIQRWSFGVWVINLFPAQTSMAKKTEP